MSFSRTRRVRTINKELLSLITFIGGVVTYGLFIACCIYFPGLVAFINFGWPGILVASTVAGGGLGYLTIWADVPYAQLEVAVGAALITGTLGFFGGVYFMATASAATYAFGTLAATASLITGLGTWLSHKIGLKMSETISDEPVSRNNDDADREAHLDSNHSSPANSPLPSPTASPIPSPRPSPSSSTSKLTLTLNQASTTNTGTQVDDRSSAPASPTSSQTSPPAPSSPTINANSEQPNGLTLTTKSSETPATSSYQTTPPTLSTNSLLATKKEEKDIRDMTEEEFWAHPEYGRG